MWHVTRDTWQMTVWQGRFVEDIFTKDDSLRKNQWIYDKGVCRTAPATLGLLDCRGNMLSRYGIDLTCRVCQPDPASGLAGQNETQEHLIVYPGYGELWQGLGPLTPQARATPVECWDPWIQDPFFVDPHPHPFSWMITESYWHPKPIWPDNHTQKLYL